MSIIKIIEESLELPIQLEEIKLFLKVDYEDEDEIITRAFKTAVKQCEITIGQTIIEKTYSYSTYKINKNEIQLLYGPVKNIESIKVLSKNYKETQLSDKDYFFDNINDKIIFKNNIEFYRINIIYSAVKTDISDDLKQAILIHTAKIFEDRLGYSQIPQSVINIYKNYKITRL